MQLSKKKYYFKKYYFYNPFKNRYIFFYIRNFYAKGYSSGGEIY